MIVKSFIGGTDYDDQGSHIVTIPAEEMNSSLNIAIKPDNVVEDNENFHLFIDVKSLPDSVRLGSPNTTTVIIMDDDSKLLLGLYFVDVIQKSKLSINYVFFSGKSKGTVCSFLA